MAYPSDASLVNIGQTQLGKSGDVKLSELNSADAESRVYATYGYKRVNNNEEADNDCPSQADAASSTVGADNSLAKWIGYAQWETSNQPSTSEYPNAGSNFNLTAKDAGSAENAGTANFSWTKPSGYANFPQGYVNQELWVRACTGSSFPTDCENDDPFAGNINKERVAMGDGTTGQVTDLRENHYYVAGVRMLWNDENDSAGTYTQTGAGYRIAGSLAHSGTDYGNGAAIVFQAADFIPCVENDCGLGSDRGTACLRAGSNADHAYLLGGGGLSQGYTIYQSGCSSVITDDFIAYEEGGVSGTNSYSVNGSGVIQSDPQECEL